MRRKLAPPFFLLPIIAFFGLFVGLSSCSYKHYRGFEKIKSAEITWPKVFDSSFHKATYLTDFEVFGNQLSGITIIKKVEQTSVYHVVFISQIGLKYFDLEIAMDKQMDWFNVNYIMESLNREFIISALKNDLELLFVKQSMNAMLQLYQNPENKMKEITVKDGKNISSYLLENDLVSSITLRKRSAVIASIILNNDTGIYPKKIKISNRKARLKIILREIEIQ